MQLASTDTISKSFLDSPAFKALASTDLETLVHGFEHPWSLD